MQLTFHDVCRLLNVSERTVRRWVHVVLSVPGPQVTLCFLQHPIDFKASDRRPVDTLFVMVSPTARWHSLLITQVARALSNPAFRELVLRKAAADGILEAARAFPLAGTNGTTVKGGTL